MSSSGEAELSGLTESSCPTRLPTVSSRSATICRQRLISSLRHFRPLHPPHLPCRLQQPLPPPPLPCRQQQLLHPPHLPCRQQQLLHPPPLPCRQQQLLHPPPLPCRQQQPLPPPPLPPPLTLLLPTLLYLKISI